MDGPGTGRPTTPTAEAWMCAKTEEGVAAEGVDVAAAWVDVAATGTTVAAVRLGVAAAGGPIWPDVG